MYETKAESRYVDNIELSGGCLKQQQLHVELGSDSTALKAFEVHKNVTHFNCKKLFIKHVSFIYCYFLIPSTILILSLLSIEIIII